MRLRTLITLFLLLLCSVYAAGQSTCSNPIGPIKQNTQPPPYCYTIPATDTVDVCFTFVSPGSILYFPFPPTGMCSSITATAVLYDSACNIVDANAFANFVFVNQGASYVWCLRYVCDGTHSTTYCPTYFDFSALPVEWLSFEGKYDSQTKKTKLKWSTASELNNEYFEIQRNAPGVFTAGATMSLAPFTPVGRVGGNGTTNVQHNYTFDHTAPPDGVSLYRIKQVDKNGGYKYSKVIQVKKPVAQPEIWHVYDIIGRQVAVLRDDELEKLVRGWYVMRSQGRVIKYVKR